MIIMKKLSIIAVIFVLLFGYSCKKNDSYSEPDYFKPLFGSWKFIKGSDEFKYMKLGNDYIFHEMYANEIGIKSSKKGVFSVTKNQILFSDNSNILKSTSIYNYTQSGDTLTLDNGETTLKLLVDDTAPTPDEWLVPINSSNKFDAPIQDGTDITFDGNYLWYGNTYSSDYLYKIDPTDGATDSVLITQSAWAVESDGGFLWVSSNGHAKIHKLDATNGNLISSSIDMGAWIYGIAKQDNFLWCYSNNERTLYKYDINLDAIASSTEISGNRLDGLAFSNGHLYFSSEGSIHKSTLNPLNVVSSYKLEGYSMSGIAFDGASFWTSAYNMETGKYEILKLSGI